MTLEELEQEALNLPDEKRIELAERIMLSVRVDPEIENAWIAEIKRRDQLLQEGRIAYLPVEDALAELEAKLDAKNPSR